jgi:hypothetical protein
MVLLSVLLIILVIWFVGLLTRILIALMTTRPYNTSSGRFALGVAIVAAWAHRGLVVLFTVLYMLVWLVYRAFFPGY